MIAIRVIVPKDFLFHRHSKAYYQKLLEKEFARTINTKEYNFNKKHFFISLSVGELKREYLGDESARAEMDIEIIASNAHKHILYDEDYSRKISSLFRSILSCEYLSCGVSLFYEDHSPQYSFWPGGR